MQRRALRECTMRPVLVVMRDIHGKDVLEVPAANDQDPVDALPADAADPALGVCPRFGRPHRRVGCKYSIG